MEHQRFQSVKWSKLVEARDSIQRTFESNLHLNGTISITEEYQTNYFHLKIFCDSLGLK